MLDVKNSFSKASKFYSASAEIQNKVGHILAQKIKTAVYNLKMQKKILDIGCGPGNFTEILQEIFSKDSQIYAFDISDKMIKIAENNKKSDDIFYFCADGQNFENLLKIKDKNGNFLFSQTENEKFDVITSNSTLQWFENFEKILKFYLNFLKKDGFFLFSAFGNKTFCELDSSLKKLNKHYCNSDCEIIAKKFNSKEDYLKIIKKLDIKKFHIEETFIRKNFKNMLEFLRNIKKTGTNIKQNNINKFFWTRGVLENLENIYRKEQNNFSKDKNKIFATYHVILCEIKNNE